MNNREKFEVFALEQACCVKKYSHGGYESETTDLMWDVWQNAMLVCEKICDDVAAQFQKEGQFKFAELRDDAETGALRCGVAMKRLEKETADKRIADLEEDIAELRKRLAEFEWRDIESAPMDGTVILIAGYMYNDAEKDYFTAEASYSHNEWRNAAGDSFWPPVKWMPLPVPKEAV